MEAPEDVPERRPVDVPLLVGIALGGGVIGLMASLGALPGSLELIAFVVLATAALIATLRRIPQDAFRHLFFGFTLAGFVGANVKVVLWQRYLAAYPELVNQTAAANGTAEIPRVAVVISNTLFGAFFGLVVGLVAWYMVRHGPGQTRSDK